MIAKEFLNNHITCLTDAATLENPFEGFYVGDILSIALKRLQKNEMFITNLNNRNVLKVASVKLCRVVLCTDEIPPFQIIQKANELKICILYTKAKLSEVISRFYERSS